MLEIKKYPSILPEIQHREPFIIAETYEIPTPDRASKIVEIYEYRKELTFAHLAILHMSKSVCASSDIKRREALLDLSCVIKDWIDSIEPIPFDF